MFATARLRPLCSVVGVALSAAAPASAWLCFAEGSGDQSEDNTPPPYPPVETRVRVPPTHGLRRDALREELLANAHVTWKYFAWDIMVSTEYLCPVRNENGVQVYTRPDDPLHGDQTLLKLPSHLDLDHLDEMKKLPNELKEKITAALEGRRVWRAAETVVRAPIDDIKDLWTLRNTWDHGTQWHVIPAPNSLAPVIKVTTRRQPFISVPRQFFFRVHKLEEPLGSLPGSVAVVYSPVDPEDMPTDDSVVRGLATAVVLMEPRGSQCTRLVYAFCVDYNGKLPALAFAGAADAEAAMLGKFAQYADSRLNGHP